MKDPERPGAGQPWRSRPRRRPRPVRLEIRRQAGRPMPWRPGRLIAVIEDGPQA